MTFAQHHGFMSEAERAEVDRQRALGELFNDEFFAKLANHEYEFGQGDVLTVDLIAEQELNEFVGAYENKSFHITKVYKHSKGPKQESLF